MYVKTVCSPPLGTTTVVESSERPLHFDVILETAYSNTTETENWNVELWYGVDGQADWDAARFRVGDQSNLVVLNGATDKKQKLFALDLEYSSIKDKTLNYTVRFQTEPNGPWYWARDQADQGDGRLIFKASAAQTLAEPTFEELFTGSDEGVKVFPATSQVTGVSIWNVVAPVPAQNNTTYGSTIGMPLLLDQFYALVKLNSPWMGPRQGSTPFMIDRDALMVGYIRTDGRHVVVLGVAAIEDTTTYIRSGTGKILMKTRNDGKAPQTHKAIISTGMDYQATIDAAFYRAREMMEVGGVVAVKSDSDQIVKPEWYQSWYDGLAYCTWNGLGRELTEKRVLDALQDLYDSGIKVSALIIDDNWQSLINRKWDKFEADPVMFPNGLKGLTTEIKRKFPQIKHIAVWHAMFGYWDGIAPGGWIDQNYKCETVKWHGGHDVRLVHPDDVNRLYNDFYKFLSDNGVDAVKTDVQCSIDELDNGVDRQRVSRAYQDAFKIASLKYFDRRVIYCMAMQPFIFWHSLIPHDAPIALFRNSDDFFPDIPSSHNWHVFCNAMNNLYTGRLNGLPDWDMFQSSLTPYGSLHAAARCMSGGPIYITDSPGKHDVSLTNQMSAVTPMGNTVILRPDLIAQPTNPFVRYEGTQFLRVSNFSGGKGGNSLLATFNTSPGEITEVVKLEDFRGIIAGQKYVIRGHKSKSATGEVVTGDGKTISITLPSSGWEIFTATRVEEVAHPVTGTKHTLGSFGLTDKMAGAAAVIEQKVYAQNRKVLIEVTLKALGRLGFYVSDLSSRDLKTTLITIHDEPIPFSTVSKGTNGVLFVDTVTAWKEMGLCAGNSNEVTVTLHLD